MAKKVRSRTTQSKAKSTTKASSSSPPARKKKTAVADPRGKKKKKAAPKPVQEKLKKAVSGKPKAPAKKKAAKSHQPVSQKKAQQPATKPKTVKKKAAKATTKIKTSRKPSPAPEIRPPAVKPTARVSAHLASVKAFDQAFKLFSRHDFDKASQAFARFIERFADEAEMIARARTYVAICEQQLRRSPTVPRDAEALYDRGVVELNRGEIKQAISFFESALKYEPQSPHVLYSLAAAHARSGEVEKAIEELRQAITEREVLRVHARRDSDFVNLYRNPEFQDLVGWELVEDAMPVAPPTEM